MVQRCSCLLLAEYQSRHPLSSTSMIAEVICDSRLLQVEKASVEKSIATMISRGSYYRSLEGALGAGVTLTLGTEVAETT